MKEKLEEKLGKEKYEKLTNYLSENELTIEKLYELEPQKRIRVIANFCNSLSYDFSEVYSVIETTKDETMKAHALRAAVAAILARDGPAAISNPELYTEIRKKLKS